MRTSGVPPNIPVPRNIDPSMTPSSIPSCGSSSGNEGSVGDPPQADTRKPNRRIGRNKDLILGKTLSGVSWFTPAVLDWMILVITDHPEGHGTSR
jgi:hypothetical protein